MFRAERVSGADSCRSCYNTESLHSKQPRAAELRGEPAPPGGAQRVRQLTRDAPESQTTHTHCHS